MNRIAFPTSLAVSALACTLFFPMDADACGGLFCSSSTPVNQAAERIIFSQNDDDTVTAIIEIIYEGPAHEFAWVLPVPAGEVEVEVSSGQALDALQAGSNPLYNLQTTTDCSMQNGGFLAGSARNTDAASPLGDDAESGVSVVASGSTGPYDYIQLAVDEELDDPAQEAIDWLERNEYDVTDIGPDLLRIYLEQGMDLLAFRLSKDKDSGSIRPVRLTYGGQVPLIPIQPTAVAALEDMGILVWVLGDDRAVPSNYLHLELNEARINWLNPNANYNEVVIEAANEAGGQGFVTEHSGDASEFVESLYPTYIEDQFEALRTAPFANLAEFLQQTIYAATAPFVSGGSPVLGDIGFGQELYDGFMDVMSDPTYVPLREGATAQQLVNCVACYFEEGAGVRNEAYPPTPYVPGEDPIEQLDVMAFLDRLETLVFGPLAETRELFEKQRKVTRFYTTLSPDEMTMDPVFDFNPDLDDYDNLHTAERVLSCDGTKWTITLPQGHTIRGENNDWPVANVTSAVLPYNARVLQLSTTGDGQLILDNTDRISDGLEELGVGSGSGSSGSSGGGLCGISPGTPTDSRTSPWAWWALLGLVLLRRKPQRPHSATQ